MPEKIGDVHPRCNPLLPAAVCRQKSGAPLFVFCHQRSFGNAVDFPSMTARTTERSPRHRLNSDLPVPWRRPVARAASQHEGVRPGPARSHLVPDDGRVPSSGDISICICRAQQALWRDWAAWCFSDGSRGRRVTGEDKNRGERNVCQDQSYPYFSDPAVFQEY